MPNETKVLSINECNSPYWPGWVEDLLGQIKQRNTPGKRVVSGRHIGSLVVDFHRNLVKGGLYLYPVDSRTGGGKLRLLYECNPLAFLAEVAGGDASNGSEAILDVVPTELHQRAGLIIGPKSDVQMAKAIYQNFQHTL
jgi:fructose-1,6-bisphosphatase I